MTAHRRLLLRWCVALFVVALLVATCGSDDVSSPDPGGTTSETTEPDPGTSTDTPTSDGTPTSTDTPTSVAVLTVTDVLETRPSGEVDVQAMFIDQGAGPLLCEALAESFPPQCGGRWMVVVGLDPNSLDLVTEQATTWSDAPVTVRGSLVGDRFVVGETESAAPTEADRAIVEAFLAVAESPSETTVATLPLWSQGLELGLSDQLLVVRTPTALADPAAWMVDLEAFRGWVGPFSALELLGQDRPLETLVGPHNHCASPPAPPPESVAELRRVSVSPTDATSCLEWWTVDFFVDDAGDVHAVTLDLWEP